MPDLLDPLGAAGNPGAILGDAAWLHAMVEAEVALVVATVDQGLAPDWMSAVADQLLNSAQLDATDIAAASRSGGNPVIPLVKRLGPIADAAHPGGSDYLHLGATSQDILDTAAMLIASRVARATVGHLTALALALAPLARLHRATPMAGRTLGQHAAPIAFGLVVAGWLDGILAARDQLLSVSGELPLQYGGAVGSRAALRDIIRERRSESDADEVVDAVVDVMAARLGLRATVPWHSNRAPVVEFGAALAEVIGAIGAMATDIAVLSRTEIAEVSERLGVGDGGSSAMPHKRNPVTSVLLVSAARRSPALVATLFEAQVTEDQRSSGAWHSEWIALRDLERIALQASATAADLAGRLEVDVSRMRSNLDVTAGLIYSERVTTILAASIGKAAAFDLVESAARESVEARRPLREVLASRMSTIPDESVRSRVLDAFDPDTGLESAGAIVDAVLSRTKDLK
jgi:3-carboxy-cis,cis-muconate cycloisomerase